MSKYISNELLNRLTKEFVDSLESFDKLRLLIKNKIDSRSFDKEFADDYLTYVTDGAKISGLLVAIENECKLLQDDIKYNITMIPQEALYSGTKAKPKSSSDVLNSIADLNSLISKPPSNSGQKN